jgi:hypothetical protein
MKIRQTAQSLMWGHGRTDGRGVKKGVRVCYFLTNFTKTAVQLSEQLSLKKVKTLLLHVICCHSISLRKFVLHSLVKCLAVNCQQQYSRAPVSTDSVSGVYRGTMCATGEQAGTWWNPAAQRCPVLNSHSFVPVLMLPSRTCLHSASTVLDVPISYPVIALFVFKKPLFIN